MYRMLNLTNSLAKASEIDAGVENLPSRLNRVEFRLPELANRKELQNRAVHLTGLARSLGYEQALIDNTNPALGAALEAALTQAGIQVAYRTPNGGIHWAN